MLQVFSCVTQDHDYRLLALAVLICATGSWTAIKTYIRARNESEETARLTWTVLSSIAMASAIWATHFVAMLAYRPGVPIGWNLEASLASLVVAAAFTALALLVGISRRLPLAPELGGALLGGGIVTMHFLGMRSFEVAGRLSWDQGEVAAAIAIAVVFGALSLSRAARPVTRFCKYGGTSALIIAICGLHFTAVSAFRIVPDPTIVIVPNASGTAVFAYVAATVALLMIGTTFLAFGLDRRVASAVLTRMRKLANATTEGIVIVRHGVIADANDRFTDLIGRPLGSLRGATLQTLWPDRAGELKFDTEISTAAGELIPVHVVTSTETSGERIYAVRDLRSKRAAEAQIDHMAHHDGLTGLANRAAFIAAVDAAIAAGDPFAVFYIDLDRFKDINDGNGHAAGDAMLVEVAKRTRTTLPGSIVARLGGDEFAVLHPLDRAAAEVSDDADALAVVLQHPHLHHGVSLRIGASIGIAVYPTDGDDAPTLIGNADIAMYEAKAERRGAARRFRLSMGETVRRRRMLAHDLQGAADGGQLEVAYQVQTSVGSGATIGFEALARWNHPRLGLILPSEFIPIAEQSGAILAIGEWVMNRACRDAVGWPEHLTVAVNLSPAQFACDVAGMVADALRRTGLRPERLEVEITESLLINDFDRTLDVLNNIKALGVSIAMDDFGTGYSSLSSLQAFPFDKIKIDRSFVDKMDRNPQAAAIVRAVVNLGHSLDIPVLAEGVEKQAHLDILKKQGCAAAQGYLMGRPTPLAGTERHLGLGAVANAA